MKAHTATGLTAEQRRLLVAVRDNLPYRVAGSFYLAKNERRIKSLDEVGMHIVTIAKQLAKIGLVTYTPSDDGLRFTMTLTDRGAAIAKSLP